MPTVGDRLAALGAELAEITAGPAGHGLHLLDRHVLPPALPEGHA